MAARLLVLCLVTLSVSALYLPAFAPTEYPKGAKVELKVNKLTSIKTQLPYEYYSVPFCRPPVIEDSAENLGELLTGDKIENSLYELNMQIDKSCQVLCRKTFTEDEIKRFKEVIDEDYSVNWIIDNMPSATKIQLPDDPATYASERGFPVGLKKNGRYYVHNHVIITVEYHLSAEYEGARIVGFFVEPVSVKHEMRDETKPDNELELKTCTVRQNYEPQPIDEPGKPVVFTYNVVWEDKPNVRWASRWDLFLKMSKHDDQIHWFSVLNSLMIVLFLTGMVAMIMMRTLHKDINRYNELSSAEDAVEETGWKLVHGDVFRTPSHPMILSVYVGTGAQLIGMMAVTLVFAVLGFLSPENRGGLLTAMLLLFSFMSVFSGYFSARMYKMFKGDNWKRTTIMTAMAFPGVMFSVFFVLNLFVWGAKSSGAVPFSTMFALLVLWFGISMPLVFLGSYFGYKKEPVNFPLRINQIPRQIPAQPWYMRPAFSIAVGGILPFGAVFIELFFIMSSIWLHEVYYMFGFLFLVFSILIVTCAEIAVVMCYFQLCSEDYHWWWRSFFTAGSSSFYLFGYSIVYFCTKLEMKRFVSGLLFFGYMFLMSYVFCIMTGTIGFVACFFFVRKIYGSIKVD